MKHLKLINEISNAPSGPTPHGNTGSAGGFTGPVSFAAHGNISGQTPIVGTKPPAVDDDSETGDWTKAKLKQSFTNDMKGKDRKRPEDDLFGKSKRRIGKLTAHMKKGPSKGMFTDEKDKLDRPKDAGGNIKSFSDFTKD